MKCSRWKHAIDFPWKWKARGKQLSIPYIHNVCSFCKSQVEKARYHALSPAQKKRRGQIANKNAARRHQVLQEELDKKQERIVALKKRIGNPRPEINGETLLDSTPFRMFLIRQRKLHGTVANLAKHMGVDPERVRTLINGYYDMPGGSVAPMNQVTLALVDEYLVKLDAEENLRILYPEIVQ